MRPFALLLLAACAPTQVPVDTPETPVMEMRVYDVPEGQRTFLATTINNVMNGEVRQGRALAGPANTLVVVAPTALHDGVATLVDTVKRTPVEAVEHANIEVRYWLVRATPEGDTPSELGPIQSALDEITAQDGVSSFQLLGQRRLRTMAGREGTSQAKWLSIQQEVRTSHDRTTVQLDLDVSFGNREMIRTELAIAPDSIVVLAQSTLDGSDLYLIVQPLLA